MKYHEYNKLNWEKRFTYLKNIVFTEDDLQQKGAKFQIARFEPGATIKKHHHDSTVEIFFILSGGGELELAGKTFQLQPNDIFLCEPGDTHMFTNTTQEELVILVFKTNEVDEDIFWDE